MATNNLTNQLLAAAAAAAANPATPAAGPAPASTLWGVNVQQGNYIGLGHAFITAQNVVGPAAVTQISQQLLDTLRTSVIDADWQHKILTLAELMQYQGFDPMHMRALLWTIFMQGNPEGVEAERYRAFLAEVLMMEVLFIQRGAAITKAQNKSDPVGASVIRLLQAKYNIQTSGRSGRNTVTLPRVAACFPEILAGLLQATTLRIIGEADLVPRGLSFSGGASLIPTGSKLIVLYLAWACTQDKIINNRRTTAPTMNQAVAGAAASTGVANPASQNFWDYVLIAQQSMLISSLDDRNNICNAACANATANFRLALRPGTADITNWITAQRLARAQVILGTLPIPWVSFAITNPFQI